VGRGTPILEVEVDSKGRVLLPSQVRKRVSSRRFELRVEDDSKIILEGMPDSESVRGKYKDLLKVKKSISQIEEDQERFVKKHTR